MLSLHAASALRGVSLRGVSLRGATTRRATTRRVEFFDTTLRDGEQGARRTFTPRSKASIAARLEREVGVDVIDAGMIGTQTSPHDLEGVRRIVRATDRARLNVLAYGARREIDAAARALRGAEDRGRLSLFLRPDDLRGADAAAQTRDVRRAVARAADLFPETQYYLVYAGERDPDLLARLAAAAAEAGATHVALADSQSTMTPGAFGDLTRRVVDAVGDEVIVAAHAHNQMGLALANSISAVGNGARQVEGCLLGLGDAGGNLATEQFLAYASREKVAPDPLFPACATAARLAPATALAAEVAAIARFAAGENQPIVGERAFKVTTGVHQNNLINYESTGFDPARAGRAWEVALNRHSSRRAFKDALRAAAPDADAALEDALWAWLKLSNEPVDEDTLRKTADELRRAWVSLVDGGVLLVPTTVGYTLAALPRGVARMDAVKGRPEGKAHGVLGVPKVYAAIFGRAPPPALPPYLCMGFLSRRVLSPQKVPASCRSDAGVGVWLNGGPVWSYLATCAWDELGELLVGSSAPRAPAIPRARASLRTLSTRIYARSSTSWTSGTGATRSSRRTDAGARRRCSTSTAVRSAGKVAAWSTP